MTKSIFVMLDELTTINLSDLDDGKLEVSTAEVVASDGRKRPHSEDGKSEITSKDHWAEEKGRRAKKFRAEWLNEVYFKDWLQPHPTDETYCICIACDIRLRCGKSELEKHASGLKHCKRMDAMKDNPVSILGSHSRTTVPILCEENGTFYVTTGEEQLDEQQDSEDSTNVITTEVGEGALSKALLELSKYLDSNSEMANRRMQMLEIEHQRRMQILNKELELRSLEILVRQKELQNLNNCTSRTASSVAVSRKTEDKY